ncbi:MAG: tRNA (N(6)-L-threonylcarbamoyladenosine(37)-C(2))-methylthiotransferase [Candidatus Bathyarchaeia archaeon]
MSGMGNTFYVEGFGCPSNAYDLRIVERKLESLGFCKVGLPEHADLIFVNSCAVKKRTQDRILSRLRMLGKLAKPVIVGGCLPLVDPKAVCEALPQYLALIGPNSIDRISEAVKCLRPGLGLNLLKGERLIKVGMASARSGEVVGIVPISEGCLGKCSFCCTRIARGTLFSYPMNSIINEIKQGVACGVKEFWLVAQDTAAYGIDCGQDLVSLLREICKIEGKFMVRVGMMNLEHCIPIIEGLADTLLNSKMFRFLHIPLQSGNNNVLKSMGRGYTVEEFIETVNFLRRAVPKLTLWTDIICGFPTEDEEAFIDSLRIISKVHPDVVNVSKFSPRPRTAASKMRMLRSKVIKDRSRRMAQLCSKIALECNKSWLNWKGELLVDEHGRDGSWICRNYSYKPVVIHDEKLSLGQWIEAKIVGATQTHLVGELS